MTARREQNRDAQRERILDAARSLFASRGFEAVTMGEVAEQAGVVRATVFNHFGSKGALVEAITEGVFDYWARHARERARRRDDLHADARARAVRAHGPRHRAVPRLLPRRVPRDHEDPGGARGGRRRRAGGRARARAARAADRARAGARRALARLRAADLASAFRSLANGTINRWLYEDASGSLRERMRSAAEIFLGPVASGRAPRRVAARAVRARSRIPPVIPLARARNEEKAMSTSRSPRPRRASRSAGAARSRELRALLADPDDTDHAISLIYALGRREFERNFQRFAASAAGARCSPSARRCSRRSRIARRSRACPEGSLGRAYLDYLERNGFAPDGLLEVQNRVQARWEREEGMPPLDPLRAWYRDRTILMHDLFHVLTDYGTDELGEGTLLAFSLAQLRRARPGVPHGGRRARGLARARLALARLRLPRLAARAARDVARGAAVGGAAAAAPRHGAPSRGRRRGGRGAQARDPARVARRRPLRPRLVST